jgi:hypothetical protein
MTPRSGLHVALAGLVLTVLCGLGMAVIVLLAGASLNAGEGLLGLVSTGIIILLVLGATLGHIAILVGLIIAGVKALSGFPPKDEVVGMPPRPHMSSSNERR